MRFELPQAERNLVDEHVIKGAIENTVTNGIGFSQMPADYDRGFRTPSKDAEQSLRSMKLPVSITGLTREDKMEDVNRAIEQMAQRGRTDMLAFADAKRELMPHDLKLRYFGEPGKAFIDNPLTPEQRSWVERNYNTCFWSNFPNCP